MLMKATPTMLAALLLLAVASTPTAQTRPSHDDYHLAPASIFEGLRDSYASDYLNLPGGRTYAVNSMEQLAVLRESDDGGATWPLTTTFNVSNGPDSQVIGPKMALFSGLVYLIWSQSDQDGQFNQLYLTHQLAGGGWTAPAALVSVHYRSAYDPTLLDVPASSGERLDLVYFLDGVPYFATTSDGNSWTTAVAFDMNHYGVNGGGYGRLLYDGSHEYLYWGEDPGPGSNILGVSINGANPAQPWGSDFIRLVGGDSNGSRPAGVLYQGTLYLEYCAIEGDYQSAPREPYLGSYAIGSTAMTTYTLSLDSGHWYCTNGNSVELDPVSGQLFAIFGRLGRPANQLNGDVFLAQGDVTSGWHPDQVTQLTFNTPGHESDPGHLIYANGSWVVAWNNYNFTNPRDNWPDDLMYAPLLSGAVTPTPPAALSPTPTACVVPFVDIAADVFYQAIAQLYCRGVVNGIDPSHYQPSGTSTRAQFAKIVVLGFGLPLVTPGNQSFSDVPAAYYAYLYIETGFAAGILQGYDQPSCQAAGVAYPCYLPNRAITRAELTKLVGRAAGYPLYTPQGGQSYVDVAPSNVFYTAIETAAHKGVVSGYPDHSFRPNQSIRRDEMAGIVYKAMITPLG